MTADQCRAYECSIGFLWSISLKGWRRVTWMNDEEEVGVFQGYGTRHAKVWSRDWSTQATQPFLMLKLGMQLDVKGRGLQT